MRLLQSLKQKPAISPQLVLANQLLQFSSLELEQAIARELAENPALESHEVQRCPVCGAGTTAGTCPSCGAVKAGLRETGRDYGDTFDTGVSSFSGSDTDSEWADPISRLPSSTTLAEHLMRQARLSLDAEDIPVARNVIGNLDDRGLFSRDVDDIASDLRIEAERVEGVLAVVQSLEPVGIGARGVRECLLIQIADLGAERQSSSDHVERTLAERLIRDHWDELERSSLATLGREVDASVEEVRCALRFIRESLNPFPAYAFWTDARCTPREDATCPQPDVIIRESETAVGGYEIELPKAGRYRLRVSSSYGRATERFLDENGSRDPQGWKRWKELCGRARLFVRSIEQRWETLHHLMTCLVEVQRDFLLNGELYLRPLTRAQVAEIMGVHESTVSRAVAGKYAELPCRKVVSLDSFFDSSAPVKHLIQKLVDQEETPLSDRAIAERLSEQGYDVSRRTVTKYRNALNILPSTLRKRGKDLNRSQ